MSSLSIRLLGRLSVRRDGQPVADLQSHKAQELLAYLLLHRERSQRREVLAALMWPGNGSGVARKYLRHTLWQLQKALESVNSSGREDWLLTDPDWIWLNSEAGLWLDVSEFELAYASVRGVSGRYLDQCQVEAVEKALGLYRGDLLEGWYNDWCLFERERLKQLYLALLEKHMVYCETQGEYEIGLASGVRALRCDVAHERTHRRMMRLYYLSGDRTRALRQYERCAAFLRQELGVEPGAHTAALHRQIRSDRPLALAGTPSNGEDASLGDSPSLVEALGRLRQLQLACAALECQLQEAIETIQAPQGQHS